MHVFNCNYYEIRMTYNKCVCCDDTIFKDSSFKILIKIYIDPVDEGFILTSGG